MDVDSIDDPICLVTELAKCYAMGIVVINVIIEYLYYAIFDLQLCIDYYIMRAEYYALDVNWLIDKRPADSLEIMTVYRNGYNAREAVRRGLLEDTIWF
ncbi:MAG: hypothetical protein Faunusvirus33_2 [Faunusvirus sp.]|jgi:hypothetical protein|uniref:Uncharacterized protein n=1 Tax=Faunusvirus sp. TaxID=2487766 RepID=A0A3G4ZXL9_9VIRU|nr:MAG: hypothetical protein Faunusvirus33_2 [Faunusvirus sp.]